MLGSEDPQVNKPVLVGFVFHRWEPDRKQGEVNKIKDEEYDGKEPVNSEENTGLTRDRMVWKSFSEKLVFQLTS